MTPAEKVVAVVITTGVVLGLTAPVDTVELAVVVEVVVLGLLAILAGIYISRVGRGVTKVRSMYLWLLIRRDKRVALGLVMLFILAVAILAPRVLAEFPVIFQRPWGVFWLVVSINLFAVGLLDDALVMHRDQSVP